MNAKQLVGLHARLWRQRFGEDIAVPWSKSCIQVNRLLKTYTAEKLEEYISYYFASYSSRFADRAGRSLGAFITELPAIIAQFQEDAGKRTVLDRSADIARIAEAAASAARAESSLLEQAKEKF